MMQMFFIKEMGECKNLFIFKIVSFFNFFLLIIHIYLRISPLRSH